MQYEGDTAHLQTQHHLETIRWKRTLPTFLLSACLTTACLGKALSLCASISCKGAGDACEWSEHDPRTAVEGCRQLRVDDRGRLVIKLVGAPAVITSQVSFVTIARMSIG